MNSAQTTRGRRPWVMGSLLGIGTLVNYLDRIDLFVTGPRIAEQFALGFSLAGGILLIGRGS